MFPEEKLIPSSSEFNEEDGPTQNAPVPDPSPAGWSDADIDATKLQDLDVVRDAVVDRSEPAITELRRRYDWLVRCKVRDRLRFESRGGPAAAAKSKPNVLLLDLVNDVWAYLLLGLPLHPLQKDSKFGDLRIPPLAKWLAQPTLALPSFIRLWTSFGLRHRRDYEDIREMATYDDTNDPVAGNSANEPGANDDVEANRVLLDRVRRNLTAEEFDLLLTAKRHTLRELAQILAVPFQTLHNRLQKLIKRVRDAGDGTSPYRRLDRPRNS